jgi:hypothetical protein
MGGYVSLIGGFAMLIGLSPAPGELGLMLGGGAAFLGILTVVLMVRAGKNIGAALLQVVIAGAVMFALVYGVMWYFTVYLVRNPHLMPFSGPTTPPK